jgi:hypothetical protein
VNAQHFSFGISIDRIKISLFITKFMVKRKKNNTLANPTANEAATEKLQFPGYPPYSPDEDIFRMGKRIDENIEDSYDERMNNSTRISSRLMVPTGNDHLEPTSQKSSANVTKEDLQALGPKDLSMDMGDDEELKQRIRPVDFTGKNLDVPGSEEDDQQAEIGSEDEENNFYSQADSE